MTDRQQDTYITDNFNQIAQKTSNPPCDFDTISLRTIDTINGFDGRLVICSKENLYKYFYVYEEKKNDFFVSVNSHLVSFAFILMRTESITYTHRIYSVYDMNNYVYSLLRHRPSQWTTTDPLETLYTSGFSREIYCLRIFK